MAQGTGSIPDQGTKIPYAVQLGQKKKKIRNPAPIRTSKSAWIGEKSVPWISVSPFILQEVFVELSLQGTLGA